MSRSGEAARAFFRGAPVLFSLPSDLGLLPGWAPLCPGLPYLQEPLNPCAVLALPASHSAISSPQSLTPSLLFPIIPSWVRWALGVVALV